MVSEECISERLHFVKSLTNTRRSLCLFDDKYLFLFKKSPVANVKTKQDDLLKNQEISKHVLILTYKVDEFWSSISRLEFQYFDSPNRVSYTYDISHYMRESDVPVQTPMIKKPKVSIKKSKNSKNKAS